MEKRPRLLRITTVPISLRILLKGQLEFMQQNGMDVLAVSSDGPEVSAIVAQGIAHRKIPMTRKITPLKDLVSLLKLIAIIREFKPDIVHTHTPKAGLLGMLAAWICRVPVRLHTVAGMPLMETRGVVRKILIFTERMTYACATGVYPNSTGLLKFVEDHIRSDRSRLNIIGKGSSNGIDSAYFSLKDDVRNSAVALRATHAIPNDDVIFCFVGRIVRDKGVNELVTAFEKIAAELSARLILVGPFEDDLDPVSEQTRQALTTNPRIITMGYLQDVRPALAAADIFVFPSYREGFPNVVMQACCLELPCIVSDINGCDEIIDHNNTGLIVKPKDVGALYNAMKQLAMQPLQRKEFGRRSRKFVAENFDQTFVWKQILSTYKQQLDRVHAHR